MERRRACLGCGWQERQWQDGRSNLMITGYCEARIQQEATHIRAEARAR
jgi:hypothetical protein